jgi:stage II sporulation protein AB (anti-sigma F factor)
LTEISDIKTAVSEGVTNCIVHAYGEKTVDNKVVIECLAKEADGVGELHIKIIDFGCGIEDVEKALSPFYTTLEADERSGMGFTIMQAFTDGFSVTSEKGKGTVVDMLKKIGGNKREEFSPPESLAIGERKRVNA